MAWEPLGRVDPTELTDTRLDLHWAAQLIAAFGQNCLEPNPDDSHRSMRWSPAVRGFLASETAGPSEFSVGIQVAEFTFLTLERGEVTSETELSGLTLDEGYSRLESAVNEFGLGCDTPFERPEYEMPEHRVGEGRAFSVKPGPELEELARWYANTADTLARIRESHNSALARCWPHHFDLATLIEIDGGEDEENARSVGVGLSPGDHGYAEPYWYVTPWPYPEGSDLPDLDGGGRWHTDGWVGAILTGSNLIVGDGTTDPQERRLEKFLDSGIRAARSLLQSK